MLTTVESPDEPQMVKCDEWSKSVTKVEFDRAREKHDIFTLLVMVRIIESSCFCLPSMSPHSWFSPWCLCQLPVMIFSYLDFRCYILYELVSRDWRPSEYFWHLWWATAFYVFADLIWILRVPHCVRTPKTLIEVSRTYPCSGIIHYQPANPHLLLLWLPQHHFVVLLYIICPLPWMCFRPFMGPLMSVEFNSFFAIARRVAWKRNCQSVGNFFHFMFLSTWIQFRCILYPAIGVAFLRCAHVHFRPPFTAFQLSIVFLPVHFYFVIMNLYWTKLLFTPILRDVSMYWTKLLMNPTLRDLLVYMQKGYKPGKTESTRWNQSVVASGLLFSPMKEEGRLVSNQF